MNSAQYEQQMIVVNFLEKIPATVGWWYRIKPSSIHTIDIKLTSFYQYYRINVFVSHVDVFASAIRYSNLNLPEKLDRKKRKIGKS